MDAALVPVKDAIEQTHPSGMRNARGDGGAL
jgi:hypothetical protein